MAKAKKEIKEEVPAIENVKVGRLDSSGEQRWVKVTEEEIRILEKDGRIVGYNPQTKEALIK